MNPSSPLSSQPLFDAHVPSAEALRAIEAHPRFSASLRLIAAGAVAQYRGNRILNMMITDRARFLIGVFAIHLHYLSRPGDPRSGLTLSRVKAICIEQKICSPGRAEAMLILMRMFGYLASARSEEDRRLHRLVPTDALIGWHRERLAFTLEAVAGVLPEGAQVLAVLDSPDFLARFVSHVARLYLSGFYYVDYVPELKFFFERNAGVVILFSIMLAGEAGDSFPPRGPVSILPATLARQFGVSRPHVRRLMHEAINAGLLQRDETKPDGYRTLPALNAAFARITALYILHNAHAARAALAEVAPQSEVACRDRHASFGSAEPGHLRLPKVSSIEHAVRDRRAALVLADIEEVQQWIDLRGRDIRVDPARDARAPVRRIAFPCPPPGAGGDQCRPAAARHTMPDGYRALPALNAAFARFMALHILHLARRARRSPIAPRSEVAQPGLEPEARSRASCDALWRKAGARLPPGFAGCRARGTCKSGARSTPGYGTTSPRHCRSAASCRSSPPPAIAPGRPSSTAPAPASRHGAPPDNRAQIRRASIASRPSLRMAAIGRPRAIFAAHSVSTRCSTGATARWSAER